MARKPTVTPEEDISRPRYHRLRSLVIGLLIALGSLSFGSFVVTYWLEQQVLTTDNWVAMVGPLPKQPVVSTALGSYISDQVFDTAAVKQNVAEALPPRAEFLSGPLTTQLKSLTTKTAQTVVASDGFQSIWISANRIAMDRLVTTARDPSLTLKSQINERFNIDLTEVRGKVQSVLGDSSTAVPGLQSSAQNTIAIAADLQARADRIRSYIQSIDLLSAVLPWLAAAALLWALALSWHRRATSIAIVVTVVVIMFIELIAIKWLRRSILDQVSSDAAISYIYDQATAWLIRMIGTVLIAAAVIFAILMTAGPYGWARSFRSFIRIDQLRSSSVGRWWQAAREWTGRYEYYLWAAVVVIVLAGVTAFMTPDIQVMLAALFIMISIFAVLHLVAVNEPLNQRKI